jgi:hypothetical protein
MGSYESGAGSNGFATGYIDPTDVKAKDLQKMMDWFYNTHYQPASAFQMQAMIDKRFKAGDQRLYNAAYGSNSEQMQKYFFNLIRRHTNMIEGFQRKNRKSSVTLPVGADDDALADDYNAVLRWCDDRDGFQEYFSQAFANGIDVGESLLHLYPDYTYDPISGDLFTDCVSVFYYLMDNYSRKQDLSDCNGIWRRRWTSPQAAMLLLPGYKEEIKKMKPAGMKDGRFPLQAELQNVASNALFTFDEFYYRTTRRGKIILDPKTGESSEWEEDETEDKDMLDRVLAQQPWLKVHEIDIPTVKMVISLGGKTVYEGPNLLNIDPYPFIPLQCYVDQDLLAPAWRKQGVVRGLRDSNFLYNMRKVIELQLLQSSVNAGWIYPVDAVADPKCFRQSSGGDGFLIPLKTGRSVSEIQRIEPVNLPSSLIELSNSLAEDIAKISGVNEELLGAATDDKSGVLAMLRQGAGLTTLQTIFDKADYSQRLYSKIRLQAIRKNFSKGKIRNILGHEADPRFFTSHSQKYNVVLEEGNYSATQRQTELQQLLYFKELGINISDKSIVRAAIITDKKQVLADMEEAAQQQQQQQQQEAQKQAQIDEIKSRETMSRAALNMAKTQESTAKVQDLFSSAELKRTESDLDLVKMMMELEDMQFSQFERAFQFAQAVKLANAEQQQTAVAV